MKTTYQYKYNQSKTESSQPISSNRRGSQTISTQNRSRIGNNPLQNKGYLAKNEFSQKNIFNKSLQHNELLSLSPDANNYQQTEGRKTLRSCFKKKRTKTIDGKNDTSKKPELKMNINQSKDSKIPTPLEKDPKKRLNIITINRGINKEVISTPKNNFDTYSKNYSTSKITNKMQSKYTINSINSNKIIVTMKIKIQVIMK